jgi:valyl-tRNA synthetase
LQTSQGYIIRILQHFATKLWNITNFVMLFQAVMKFLPRSKFSLLRKWSIAGCRTQSVEIFSVMFAWFKLLPILHFLLFLLAAVGFLI